MVVAFLSTPASMTADEYDRVIEQLDVPGAGDPPGRPIRRCFGPAGHLTVFDVWDSVEEPEVFGVTLMPSAGQGTNRDGTS